MPPLAARCVIGVAAFDMAVPNAATPLPHRAAVSPKSLLAAEKMAAPLLRGRLLEIAAASAPRTCEWGHPKIKIVF